MSFDTCAELVRAGDPDRFMSAMTAPPDHRDGLLALYAFNLEIAQAPWASSEEMIAEMRLQWWADAVSDLYAGTIRHHQVLAPLAEIVTAHNLPQPLLQEMVEARRFDIHRDGHKNRATFDEYINATSGNLMQLAAMTLGAGTAAMPIIQDFAYGAGVANLLRALPALYAYGRHPVPVDCALDRNAVAEGIVPDNLATALQSIANDAIAKTQKSRRSRHLLPKTASSAMLSGWQADISLRLVATDPHRALTTSMETSEFRKKFGLIARSTTGLW